MQPFSRHTSFFASLKQVEDRLAAEEQPPAPRQPVAPPLFSDTMTASPLFLGASTATATDRGGGGESSDAALDFLTLSKDEARVQEPQQDSDDDDDDDGDDSGADIARLMALLGLSPPPWIGDDGRDSGGCDCSGGDGFMAKVVGVVGPKCEKEKGRVDGWIQHYYGGGGECREPARLAHLLLAKASWSWDGEGPEDRSAIAFPSAVKEFLDRDAPPRLTEEGEHRETE
ncbi:uncharacterized protein [Aegilops tauschii subsp. strangulata]|uniref:Uncharacterized protein n=2 Tax=Aegilops tauschii subsp. strangulata TaxID=200361 RepID=A0A453ELP9_AEGTS|nr:uncharacterized protein LOC109756460 [Aegilops tauschii subsp. strangulata]